MEAHRSMQRAYSHRRGLPQPFHSSATSQQPKAAASQASTIS